MRTLRSTHKIFSVVRLVVILFHVKEVKSFNQDL